MYHPGEFLYLYLLDHCCLLENLRVYSQLCQISQISLSLDFFGIVIGIFVFKIFDATQLDLNVLQQLTSSNIL